MPSGVETITDDHRKLIFSVMQMLKRVASTNPDNVEAATRILSDEFGVDPSGLGGIHDEDIDVLETFRVALRDAEKRRSLEQDEKFNSFVELLVQKGYFKGVEPGTADYEQRLLKAKEKFNERNDPFKGLTAEQIKNKGNELMSQAKYKEAIVYYTKAIELEPQNAVFFANRAAAHTHLKDYRDAVLDCDRAIELNPSYSKSYSRLGTALFYQEDYSSAVTAFEKACELDPANAGYKEDLKRAEEKLKAGSPALGGFPGAMPGGMPGMGGFPDMSQFANLMNNPQFLETANRMMHNPQFSNLVSSMAQKFSDGAVNPEELLEMGLPMQGQEVDDNGDVQTPFGKMSPDALRRFQEEEVRKNPKLASIMEDVRQNGYSAFQKYLGDPDVMNLMIKFQGFMLSGNN